MGNVGQKIKKGLQLHNKWVRVMLMISIVLLVGIFFYPNTEKILYMSKSKESGIKLDTVSIDFEKNTSITIMPNGDTIIHNQIKPINRRIASVEEKEPLQVQIVQEEKPFDWKGTITWIIGAINGLVLMFLNIKNMLKRTP